MVELHPGRASAHTGRRRELQLDGIGEKLLDVVNAIFALLALLGIVTDPTTAGVGDSSAAMAYDKPKEG